MSIRKLPSRILEPSQNIANIETQGIKFPGTQVASADPNTLDDYEEGTWTPVIQGYDAAGTTTDNNRSPLGTYTKIGKKVFLQCLIDSFNTGGSGRAIITGVPFASSAEYVGECQMNEHSSNYPTTICNISSIIQTGEIQIHMRGTYSDTTQGPYYIPIQNSISYLRISIGYTTY